MYVCVCVSRADLGQWSAKKFVRSLMTRDTYRLGSSINAQYLIGFGRYRLTRRCVRLASAREKHASQTPTSFLGDWSD